jgi:hypothetical protein
MKLFWDIAARASLLSAVFMAWVLAGAPPVGGVHSEEHVLWFGAGATVICLVTAFGLDRRRLAASGILLVLYAGVFAAQWLQAMAIS